MGKIVEEGVDIPKETKTDVKSLECCRCIKGEILGESEEYGGS